MESKLSQRLALTRDYLRPYWRGVETLRPEHNNFSSIVLCHPEAGYVVKMPHTNHPNRLRALEYEAEVLELLADAPEPPVQVPRLLEYGLEYPYIVTSFIPGTVLERHLDHTLPRPDMMAIGEQIATFMHWFSSVITPQFHAAGLGGFSVRFARRSQLDVLCEQAPIYIQLDTPNLEQLLHEIMENQYDFAPLPGDVFFGHNDLHFRNMALARHAEGWRLNGVFDMGLAQPSSPAQEMRYLYGISPAAAEVCARRYEQLSGEFVNRTVLRLWGTAEYVLTMRYIITHASPPDRFTVAKNALMRMYPAVDWSELDIAYSRCRVQAGYDPVPTA